MLTSLRIKNLALVTDLTLEPGAGYNVITGETGAGKSILIGALNLVLGERADRGLIRSGTDAATVEASFDVSRLKAPLKSFLEENGLEPCEDHLLVLKRTLTSAGTNRQFVNGSPTTLNVLASIGEWLVDIHGPHEHQSLLHPARQLAILDAFGKLEPQRQQLTDLVARRAELEQHKSTLIVDERTYAQQLDLLRFQVTEITQARLTPGEEEQVSQEHQRASNAARLLQLGQMALELLGETENSLVSQVGILGRTLQELTKLDTGAASMATSQQQLVELCRDLQNELAAYTEKLELDPGRLQELEERLDLLHSLKRKYGSSIQEVIAFGEEAARKLQALEGREAELERLNFELKKLEAELAKAAAALTEKRKKLVAPLCKAVVKQLSDLGFKQSKFDISVSSAGEQARGITGTGWDTLEFLFAPNPGEPMQPLRAIASSGELARVMLALKTVLAAEDQVPVLVFDEVDANVGGETAKTVGEKMRQIGSKRQVLCITHLPQVAAPAINHFVASKKVIGGRTISELEQLDGEARVTELARMLGGQSEAARKHAEALLDL